MQADPVCRLILAERTAQKAQWGKQYLTPTDWLLVLNEEMGELAKELWEKTDMDRTITEAVQVTAMALQIAEWCSERAGWENTSEEALLKSLNKNQLFSTWDSNRLYLKLANEVGSLAFAADQYSDQGHTLLTHWSNSIRNLIGYGYMLIHELTKQQANGAQVD